MLKVGATIVVDGQHSSYVWIRHKEVVIELSYVPSE
jgi:hypothetical protein